MTPCGRARPGETRACLLLRLDVCDPNGDIAETALIGIAADQPEHAPTDVDAGLAKGTRLRAPGT
jgi:hypothetical protein